MWSHDAFVSEHRETHCTGALAPDHDLDTIHVSIKPSVAELRGSVRRSTSRAQLVERLVGVPLTELSAGHFTSLFRANKDPTYILFIFELILVLTAHESNQIRHCPEGFSRLQGHCDHKVSDVRQTRSNRDT